MLSCSDDAAASANRSAAASEALSVRRPSRGVLLERLEQFFLKRDKWGSFPTVAEFMAAGRETLYWQLRATDSMSVWAEALGFPSASAERTKWTGPVIESELARMLSGRAVFPTCSELEQEFGLEGRRVYMRVREYGGVDFWARWMGVLPRNPDNTDIERALSRFLAGREIWPTSAEFRLAGLTRLEGRLKRTGEIERWREHFNLTTTVWSKERVERTLLQMCDRLGRFPTRDEMAEAGGLVAAVRVTGGVAYWADNMGLPAPKRGRPAMVAA